MLPSFIAINIYSSDSLFNNYTLCLCRLINGTELNVINIPYDIITQCYKYGITSQEKENIYHSVKSTEVGQSYFKG